MSRWNQGCFSVTHSFCGGEESNICTVFDGLLDSYLTPELGFVTIVFWILTPVLLAGLRWHLILRYVLKMNISLSDSIRIHCTSLFFNGFLPGAVGGDAVKVMFGF